MLGSLYDGDRKKLFLVDKAVECALKAVALGKYNTGDAGALLIDADIVRSSGTGGKTASFSIDIEFKVLTHNECLLIQVSCREDLTRLAPQRHCVNNTRPARRKTKHTASPCFASRSGSRADVH